MSSVYVCGDIHGQFNYLNQFINKKKPDIILQCGDWGIWNSTSGVGGFVDIKRDVIDAVKPGNTKIYFCPGNHEQWDYIEEVWGRYGREPIAVDKDNPDPRIWYCPLGSVLKIGEKHIMFLGGADSIDKNQRWPGVSWWEQELLTEKDINYIEEMWGDALPKIDTVISHTCPTSMLPKMLDAIGKRHEYYKGEKGYDISCHALEFMLDKLKPSTYYFAHWHAYTFGSVKNCRWTALSHITSGSKWWINLI